MDEVQKQYSYIEWSIVTKLERNVFIHTVNKKYFVKQRIYYLKPSKKLTLLHWNISLCLCKPLFNICNGGLYHNIVDKMQNCTLINMKVIYQRTPDTECEDGVIYVCVVSHPISELLHPQSETYRRMMFRCRGRQCSISLMVWNDRV